MSSSFRISSDPHKAAITFTQWMIKNGIPPPPPNHSSQHTSPLVLSSPSSPTPPLPFPFGIKRSNPFDWTLVSTRDISQHQKIVTIPNELTMGIFPLAPSRMTASASSSFPPSSYLPLDRLLPHIPSPLWQLSLGFRLLSEYYKMSPSPSIFTPYIDILPSSFPLLPLFYPPSVIQSLQYVPMIHQINKRSRLLQELFTKSKSDKIFRSILIEGGIIDKNDESMNINEVGWAMSAVSSRAFNMEKHQYHRELMKEKGQTVSPVVSPSSSSSFGDISSLSSRRLLPLLDLCNHSSTPNCKISFTPIGMELSSILPINYNSPLTISYGNHLSNDNLLIDYGWIEDENFNNDTISLKVDTNSMSLAIEMSDNITNGNLQSSNLDTQTSPSPSPSSSWQSSLIHSSHLANFTIIGKKLDPNLLSAFRILLAKDEDGRKSFPLFHEEWSRRLWENDAEGKYREEDNRVASCVITYLELILSSFPTSIGDDVKILHQVVEKLMEEEKKKGEKRNENFTPMEMAIRYRLSKKRLLMENITLLKQKMK